MKIAVIGGGLSGCEAAYQLLLKGFSVTLFEMRPQKMTPAHNGDKLAELVCSNSLRSDDASSSAIGLLHEELRLCNSLIMEAADNNSVPAGGALAVDRNNFSDYITEKLHSFKNFELVVREITSIAEVADFDHVIIATGPLTSEAMMSEIKKLSDDKAELNFFDAIAPIIYKDSIDMDKAWFQSRYDKGSGKDYINCPLNEEQYHTFIDNLINGEKIEFKEWEKDTPYFEGCLPIEVMAERGVKTLAFGPLKPVGLTNPHKDEVPYAVVQLRQDNQLGTIYNMVGFQTKLNYKEQKRIFRKIPGLENAEFARLGGIHRNSFICSPKVLSNKLTFKSASNISLAGQISGCEGYVESTAIGLLASLFIINKDLVLPPRNTATGGLLVHVTDEANAEHYQPMNINFGLIESEDLLNERGKKLKGKLKKQEVCKIGLQSFKDWLKESNLA